MDFWERLDHEIENHPNVRTRKALAQMAGFNVGNFGAWKSRQNMPGVHTLVHIALILGVTVEYLVTGTDSSDPWIYEHRQLIEDLKTFTPDQLADQAEAIHAIAERRRREMGKDSASG